MSESARLPEVARPSPDDSTRSRPAAARARAPTKVIDRPAASCARTSATGSPTTRSSPALVVLPETTADVAAVVTACAEAGVPFVARGSGTGLSGGALPHADGVLVVTSRMRTILEIDPDDQRAVVEPGVINLHVTRAAAPHGYYYAPDPSSQQVCTIGGNVAENSGGAHCLKYGFTTNHVLGVEVVDARRRGGRARRQGARRRPATTCSARSSAPRARSASPPRSRCG